MKNLLFLFSLFLSPWIEHVYAQKPFIEGVISYKVQLETTDKNLYSGVYTFTFKNGQLKKELKLNNGYQDIVIMNTDKNTAYSLKIKNGKKYAIQLSMDEIAKRQKKYTGYTFKEDKNNGKIIAGFTTFKGEISYPDGTHSDIYYTPEWYPDKPVTFERFPEAKFMPLSFTLTDDNGFIMSMDADKVNIAPVEDAVFRIPSDYKIIYHNEYKQLRK